MKILRVFTKTLGGPTIPILPILPIFSGLIFVTALTGLFGWMAWRSSVPVVRGAEQASSSTGAAGTGGEQTAEAARKVHFSLSTTRAYGTKEQPRIYISYQGVEMLDFRVYRIRDPFLFFRQLEDPHQMGEEDYAGVDDVSERVGRRPSILEKVRSFKREIYYRIKSYIRGQLTRRSRTAFNDKYMAGEQRPLFEADFARIPLLNPDQLVRSWRQVLSPLENAYDTRMVAIGRREPGVYLVEAVHGDRRAYTIAVVTDLTIVSKSTPDGQMLIYTVDRQTGEPRGDVRLEVIREGKSLATGRTSNDGILQTTLAADPKPRPAAPAQPVRPEDVDPEADGGATPVRDYLILAGRGEEFAVSDLSAWQFRWNRSEGEGDQSEDYAGYIYTERPIYRPGQKVYFKGILRRIGADGYEMPPGQRLTVVVSDNMDKEVLRRELPLTERGSFAGELDIAADASLGGYRITPRIGDSAVGYGYFQVAEYKKPEYKVTVTTPRKFVPVGGQTSFTVDARYFFGEPVRQAEVKYYIYRSRYHHWFWEAEDDGIGGADENDDEAGDLYGYGNDMVQEGEAKLDGNGRLVVPFAVPPSKENEPWDFTYRLTAQVTDAARRVIDGQSTFVGTRGSVVVDAAPERYVYFQKDKAKITVRAADYEGRPQSTRVGLRFVEVKYEKIEKVEEGYKYFEYRPIRRDLSTTEVTTDQRGEAVAMFEVPIVGNILIETLVREEGRQIVSTGGFLYATDRNNGWADSAMRDFGSIKLIPDKASYRPGDTARVLAVLPTEKVHLLVTTEMNRVYQIGHYRTEGRVAMLEIPITANYSPNVFLSVTYVRDGQMYENSRSLAVPAREKFLQVELIPDQKQYKPRDPAAYTIVAKNADGTPAAGVEVSLGVVDEAIYSIEPDGAGDIRRAFYGRRYSSVSTSFSSSFNFTGHSGTKRMKLAAARRSSSLADIKNENQYAEPTIRKEFRDTAFWQPDVITGADGRATARLTLPDNLTTWRATARAVSADLRVGSRIDRVLSRKDLILRLETPRFMTEGDVVTISGVVHNYLGADKVALVEIGVTGAELLDDARRTVTIARQGEQRIDWRVRATSIGNVTMLATAKTDTESDGVELPLPVVPMGLKRTKAESAALIAPSVDQVYTLNLPADASIEARSLRIEASPSIAGSLFGALDYLTSYPYGCTEQTMSGFLGNIAVAQALKEARGATIRADNNLARKVQRGLDRLADLQADDGGWGWFKGNQTDPFMTAFVVDGLILARQSGYGIDPYRIGRARQRIVGLLQAGKTADGKAIDADARAYLIYAHTISGEPEKAYLDELYNRREGLQPGSRAQLALALATVGDAGRAGQVAAELAAMARQTSSDAHWESTGDRRNLFDRQSDLETTSFVIRALSRVTPQSLLLPKAARWLVANRGHGYFWESTRDTTSAIIGLTEYLKVSRELAADYSFEIYLNGEQVLRRQVTAAEAAGGQPLTIERKGAALPGSGNQIRIVKRGAGTLYFSAALEYYTRNDQIAPQGTENLTLKRDYLRLKVTTVDGNPKWTLEPLSGDVRSGDLIVARLSLKGARSRYLMIEDPLPAGCEQIEQVDGINLDYTDGRWSDWYSRREFRDQRTVIFSDYFDGEAVYQYAMRVQVPGDFNASPARAELMYQPWIESNSAGFKIRILDRNRK